MRGTRRHGLRAITVVGAVIVGLPVPPAPPKPTASAVTRTLAEVRPMPPMCRWAAANLSGTGPAQPSRNRPAPAGIGALAPVSLQLPTGGPVPGGEPVWLRPGRYAHFVVRSREHDRHRSRDGSTGRWYYPLGQSDVTIWRAIDGSMVRHWTVQRDLDDPHVYSGWDAIPAALPDPTNPQWIAAASDWSADPAMLAEQVAMRAPDNRTYLLQEFAMRYHHLLPTLAQHAAALTVLCTTPGLHLDGPAVDQAGRPGIAVSAEHHYDDSSSARATLILDPHTWRPHTLTRTQPGSTIPWATDRSYLLLHAGYRIVT